MGKYYWKYHVHVLLYIDYTKRDITDITHVTVHDIECTILAPSQVERKLRFYLGRRNVLCMLITCIPYASCIRYHAQQVHCECITIWLCSSLPFPLHKWPAGWTQGCILVEDKPQDNNNFQPQQHQPRSLIRTAQSFTGITWLGFTENSFWFGKWNRNCTRAI